MSTYTLVLSKSGSDYTFTYTPELSIDYEFMYNQATEPPTLSGYREIWTVENATIINADGGTLATAMDTLVAFIADRATPVTAAALKKDGSAIHTISTATHIKLMVSGLEMVRSPGRHTNHLGFNFKVIGTKGVPGTESGGSGSAAVTQFEQKITFEYDQGGFLTKTVSGVLRTHGTGSQAAARILGSQELPSNYFRYATNGPEGCNVSVDSNPADNQATFSCVMVEQALEFPNASVYRFTIKESVKTSRYADYLLTTITAQGSSMAVAEAACRAERPQNAEGEEYEASRESNTFSITYVSKTPKKSFLSKEYEFSLSGGGRGIVAVPVLYGKPVMGRGPLEPWVVEETIKVTTLWSPPPIRGEQPVFNRTDLDDPSERVQVRRSKVGATSAAEDEYEGVVSRRYVYADEPPGFDAKALAAFNSVG